MQETQGWKNHCSDFRIEKPLVYQLRYVLHVGVHQSPLKHLGGGNGEKQLKTNIYENAQIIVRTYLVTMQQINLGLVHIFLSCGS